MDVNCLVVAVLAVRVTMETTTSNSERQTMSGLNFNPMCCLRRFDVGRPTRMAYSTISLHVFNFS